MHNLISNLLLPLFLFTTYALAAFPFTFTPVFSATYHLIGIPTPITIPGGALVLDPITGSISGPAINGTITGGFAHPTVYNNQTLEYPDFDLYGTTDDGQKFYIKQTGVGAPSAQTTRIELTVGGSKYSSLVDGYILASNNANANRTSVAIQAYLVKNIL